MKYFERLAILFVVMIISSTCYAVYTALDSIVIERERDMEGWRPPVIPQCNKETWIRITEGCEDE